MSSEITPIISNFGNGGYISNGNLKSVYDYDSNSTANDKYTSTYQRRNNNNTANNNNNSSTNTVGTLKVTVLAAYDLAIREPPAHVAVTVGTQYSTTGPPVQRHKDRNSFKFGPTPSPTTTSTSSPTNNINNISSNNSITSTSTLGSTTNTRQNGNTANNNNNTINSNEVTITAPLPDLYSNMVSLRLVYSNNRVYSLRTEYPLNQLNINEPMWLVLRLESVGITNGSQIVPTSTNTSTGPTSSSSTTGTTSTTNSTDDETFAVIPTIRVQMTLSGPYRYEIRTILAASTVWFNCIDTIEDNVRHIIGTVFATILPTTTIAKFDWKYILIPLVPIIVAVIVASPIVIGIGITLLPLLLPILTVIGFIVSVICLVGVTLFLSTSIGRETIGTTIFRPMATTILSSRLGQRIVYETGPRPTPVSVARAVLPTQSNMVGRLLVSLLIDAIGSSSYLVPGLGELTDLVWAPIQTIIVMALYDTTTPAIKYVSFIEELLPFTDIVPTATIGWFIQQGVPFITNLLDK